MFLLVAKYRGDVRIRNVPVQSSKRGDVTTWLAPAALACAGQGYAARAVLVGMQAAAHDWVVSRQLLDSYTCPFGVRAMLPRGSSPSSR